MRSEAVLPTAQHWRLRVQACGRGREGLLGSGPGGPGAGGRLLQPRQLTGVCLRRPGAASSPRQGGGRWVHGDSRHPVTDAAEQAPPVRHRGARRGAPPGLVGSAAADALSDTVAGEEAGHHACEEGALRCLCSGPRRHRQDGRDGTAHGHVSPRPRLPPCFQSGWREGRGQLLFSVLISSVMICRILSFSRDILGFSSFFLRTESMRTRSCLKMTAIFTGA